MNSPTLKCKTRAEFSRVCNWLVASQIPHTRWQGGLEITIDKPQNDSGNLGKISAMLAALKAVLNCPNYAEQGPTAPEFALVLKQVEDVVRQAEPTATRRPEHSMDDVNKPPTNECIDRPSEGELRDWGIER